MLANVLKGNGPVTAVSASEFQQFMARMMGKAGPTVARITNNIEGSLTYAYRTAEG